MLITDPHIQRGNIIIIIYLLYGTCTSHFDKNTRDKNTKDEIYNLKYYKSMSRLSI